ncbi:sigma 54-interacting transcriptional regulator [Photobacterium sp. GB-210]|uniref:sigma 54-interacting transcriptional regulator n=1 Tax=Photobacterium sp. GB-210 TaxID=2022104 RepID=UPI000D174599|nr:sigma 54-interacting transcriptional regulator [Photobacterium sp. GB-210]PSV38540.1 AAA family ATPase [Photobacterium sp. GB-210]
MLELLLSIRATLSARVNANMERFESDLMTFSKALLSINDISGVMDFLNNEDLLFINVERVNLLLKNDLDSQPSLYYLDQDKQCQQFDYTGSSIGLHGATMRDYCHQMDGETLYQTFPQLESHPAYDSVFNYCKIPLSICNQPLGAIEYINLTMPDDSESEKQFKLFNNMISAMIEHIIEHQTASTFTEKLTTEKNNFQVLVDVTNTVISQSTKKELIGSLLRFLYQHFGMTDLSIIQLQDGHYNQHSACFINNEIDYQCHFFTNDKLIKNAIKNKQPVFLNAIDIKKMQADNNSPYFPRRVKTACVMPLIFRGIAVGYISFMKPIEAPYQNTDLELFKQIAARVALAMHSIKTHQASIPNQPITKFVNIDEGMGEHVIFDDIISQSEVMNKVLEQVALVACCDSTVLILGESGTGKELIARAIHKLSLRSKTDMVKMNCAAIPAGLFESELFGHERGAFTGAISQRVGRFEQAHKGTLFLDEIGDMPLELQPKLLRALQENEIERVGKNALISVDVRIVVATNVDLLRRVEEKKFRNDLYYRLNVFPIQIPPLRERAEDIPLLVKHFTRELAKKMGKTITVIAAEDLAVMSAFPWPGNVRELRNFVERSVILTRGNVLNVPVHELKTASHSACVPTENAPSVGLVTPEATGVINTPESTVKGDVVKPIISKADVIKALKACHGVVAGPNGAANQLGLKRTTLLSRMQKMGIKSQDFRGGI